MNCVNHGSRASYGGDLHEFVMATDLTIHGAPRVARRSVASVPNDANVVSTRDGPSMPTNSGTFVSARGAARRGVSGLFAFAVAVVPVCERAMEFGFSLVWMGSCGRWQPSR